MSNRLEKLQDVAEDLNKCLKLKPTINADTESAKELKKAILAEMAVDGGQLYDTDQEMLKSETWDYLINTLEIEPRDAPQAKPSDKSKKSSKITEEEKEMAGKKGKGKEKKKTPAKKTALAKKVEKKKTPVKATKKKNSDNTLTIKEAKAATRKLLMASKKLTKDELAAELKGTSKQAGDALSFLKNAKYADGRPLNIVKDADGKFGLPKSKKYLD